MSRIGRKPRERSGINPGHPVGSRDNQRQRGSSQQNVACEQAFSWGDGEKSPGSEASLPIPFSPFPTREPAHRLRVYCICFFYFLAVSPLVDHPSAGWSGSRASRTLVPRVMRTRRTNSPVLWTHSKFHSFHYTHDIFIDSRTSTTSGTELDCEGHASES